MNKAEQSEAILTLRETFKAGDTVCTVLRHVSWSRSFITSWCDGYDSGYENPTRPNLYM